MTMGRDYIEQLMSLWNEKVDNLIEYLATHGIHIEVKESFVYYDGGYAMIETIFRSPIHPKIFNFYVENFSHFVVEKGELQYEFPLSATTAEIATGVIALFDPQDVAKRRIKGAGSFPNQESRQIRLPFPQETIEDHFDS